MKLARWTRRMFRTKRGQIILLLRQEPRTVSDLADALDVTNNAVRAHLASLEMDGLVRRSGERSGYRKPHFSYELTAEADELFPKAYDSILNQIVSVLKERIGIEETELVMRKVGQRMAMPLVQDKESAFEKKLDQAMTSLDNLGGQGSVIRKDGRVFIQGAGCPLSAATEEHSEICEMVEAFLSEIIGAPVVHQCRRKPSPQCCFEVGLSAEKHSVDDH